MISTEFDALTVDPKSSPSYGVTLIVHTSPMDVYELGTLEKSFLCGTFIPSFDQRN